MRTEDYYKNLRSLYKPDDLKLIFIVESPPKSGKYFYDVTGKPSEPLFRAIMKDVLQIAPKTKQEGLEAFKTAGMVLVDSTYTPVDGMNNRERNKVIVDDYPNLLSDLERINPNKEIPIILIKANVCRLLEPRLRAEGYRILNEGEVLPFPSHGQQGKFAVGIQEILPPELK